jgi:hypothetical protein
VFRVAVFAASLRALITYGPSFYRIEMLALLNDMIIVDRYLWEWLNTQTSVLDVLVLSRDERVRSDWVVSSLMNFRMIWFSQILFHTNYELTKHLTFPLDVNHYFTHMSCHFIIVFTT